MPESKTLWDPFDWVDDFGIQNLRIGTIRLEAVPASNLWKVLEPIPVTWTNRDGPQDFTIEKGEMTDLASVPAVFQSFVSPCGRIKEIAVVHDGLYEQRPTLSTGKRISRAEADWILYVGCIEIGKMPDGEARHVWEAVRLGGSRIWHSHDTKFEIFDSTSS
jgi:hypothetical protein